MITLKGEPRSTGSIYKSNCRTGFPTVYMTKEGKELKENYRQQASKQWKGKPLDSFIEISIAIYFGTKRKADWDNFHKLSMDALTGIVWEDDSLIQVAQVEKHYDKQNPRIEIIVDLIQ